MAQSVTRRIERSLTASAGFRSRPTDKASICGNHQGQRSCEIAPKGRTHDCKRPVLLTKKALASWRVAVGTAITRRPPHRSRRALLTHRAPTLGGDEEPRLWPRMQDAWERQVPVSDRLHSRPRKSTPLASAHQRAVPTFDHVMAEC